MIPFLNGKVSLEPYTQRQAPPCHFPVLPGGDGEVVRRGQSSPGTGQARGISFILTPPSRSRKSSGCENSRNVSVGRAGMCS